MKLNADLIARMATWVEEHGLFPEAAGATLREFCAAFGIDDQTYRNWLKKSAFSDALNSAREKYRARTVKTVENALLKAATGVDYEKTKQEGKMMPRTVKTYDPATGNLIKEETVYEMVTTKAVKERVYFPPDVKAAQFVLTNMSGDRWKNKESKDVKVDGKVAGLQIEVADADTAAALEKVVNQEPTQ